MKLGFLTVHGVAISFAFLTACSGSGARSKPLETREEELIPSLAEESKSDDTESESSQIVEAFDLDDESTSENHEDLVAWSGQRATILPGQGKVNFRLDTCRYDVRDFFNQGIAQLHTFEFLESMRSFRRVLELDPKCAMAYWGMSLSQIMFQSEVKLPAKLDAEKALELILLASPREQKYIRVLQLRFEKERSKVERLENFSKGLYSLIQEFPEDLELKALFVELIWDMGTQELLALNNEDLDAYLENILRVNPLHPAHHYRIHLWDQADPVVAEKALASAEVASKAADQVPHLWHMPGHIFRRLGDYQKASYHFEASMRSEFKHLAKQLPQSGSVYLLPPSAFHNFIHHADWYWQSLVSLGRGKEAFSFAEKISQLPYPLEGDMKNYFQNQVGQWFLESALLYPNDPEFLAWYQKNGVDAFLSADQKAQLLLQVVVAQLNIGKLEEAINLRNDSIKFLKDKNLPVLKTMNLLIRLFQVSEGQFDILLKINALGSMKVIQMTRLALRFQLNDLAKSWSKEGIEEWASIGQFDRTLAAKILRVEVLMKTNSDQEMTESLAQVQKMSKVVDITQPSTQFLKSLGNWEKFRSRNELLQLEAIGSLSFTKKKLRPFSVLDDAANKVAVDGKNSKPTLVVFTLGQGCSRCFGQLDAAAAEASEILKDFRVIFISSDSLEKNQNYLKRFKEIQNKSYPFPLLTDEKLEVFRGLGLYDDYRRSPLHGIFLLDRHSNIIWWDISGSARTWDENLMLEMKRSLRANSD